MSGRPIPHAAQVGRDGTIDRRAPDLNGARVRLLPAARSLAHLPALPELTS